MSHKSTITMTPETKEALDKLNPLIIQTRFLQWFFKDPQNVTYSIHIVNKPRKNTQEFEEKLLIELYKLNRILRDYK